MVRFPRNYQIWHFRSLSVI
ncbi:MAG: hypothetical protein E6K54_08955 [Gammaproteobacteria bacterium]|nr:MAG: hypothetical protein E6K54_08955 [Gammaproteobacteria bacterium]